MKKLHTFFLIIAVISHACKPELSEPLPTYDPTPYILTYGDFPIPDLPTDNYPTIAGVQLGRMLFYEKMLSKDGSQSCASCHMQATGFSDSLQFSIGVDKLPGKRQAMPVMNLAWHMNGMFWDGRSPSARDQALRPIKDPLEMNETIENAISKIQAEKKYRDQFIRAFGDDTVTADRLGLAIEQFEFSMISANSKYDRFLKGTETLSDAEERGRKLFFTEFDPIGTQRGAECFHCHSGHNFTNDEYMNNGLDSDGEVTDDGRQQVTNDPADRAKFKTPSLRNIEFTAPYMHDGRLKTLEEVVEHYNTGVKNASTVDFLLQYNLQPGGLGLTIQEKADLILFLKTLTDTQFLNNPAFSKPE
ncbi:MAG: cytochrome c peroxidase [Saprospiraceae bacterium]|nr:cytochrome c peroxidase [Saprospiraceae bacterium]